jgi:hypothetical protein
MNKTVLAENVRKNRLFDAWIGYLTHIHTNLLNEECDELIEGVTCILSLSKNRMVVRAEDSGQVYTLPISGDIRKHCLVSDKVFFVIGRKGKDWWPVDVISIGSEIKSNKNEFHITINPLYMNFNRVPRQTIH